MSKDNHSISSSSESTEVVEEEDFNSLDELEIAQHQQESMEEEVIEEPSRSKSPVMWKGMRSTVQQQLSLPPAPLLYSSKPEIEVNTTEETREFKGHRMPDKLRGVKTCRWFGTHNRQDFIQLDEELARRLCAVEADYMEVFREVAPLTKHVHYHSIVIFEKPATAFQLFQVDPFANWEPVRGQLVTAYKYISKNNDKAYQFGNQPLAIVNYLRKQQIPLGPTPSQKRFNELVCRAKAGDESIRDDVVYARNMRYFDQILISAFQPVRYEGDLRDKNLWIYGPPGTGKSRLVHDYCIENGIRCYNKLQNKWWDGYSGQQVVLIEDADPNTMKVLASHMKVWSDRYCFTSEVKGTARPINALFNLIVTSNYTIDECFNDKDALAIERRFDTLYLG